MLKVIELFAGIGAFRAALERLGIEHEIVAISEIDKFAVQSYNAMYGNTPNLGDISHIDRLPKCDLLTYGFPCQDISVAGLQKGIQVGTRSGLLFEVERLLDVAAENDELPNYLIMENVKNLVGKKHKGNFERWLDKLESLGYRNFWKILNTKDYGIPQNRERVFCISIKKELNQSFEFPEPIELEMMLVDCLEKEVDEKYYLSDKYLEYARENHKKMEKQGNGFKFSPTDGGGTAKSVTSKSGQRMTDNFVKESS